VIRRYFFAGLLIAAGTLLESAQAGGQQVPVTREQAEAILQDPTQAQLILERIRASGLSMDEIRAQLRAAGLPSGMLDAYLNVGTDSVAAPAPGQDILAAMRVLGLGNFTLRDSLLLTGDTLSLRLLEDSLRLDSILAEERAPRELSLFGLETFRQPTTEFQPPPFAAASESYVLGPGDELVLFLSGDVERANQLAVATEGFIVIPDVGRVGVAGLSLAQTRILLENRLAGSFSGIRTGTTQFTLHLSQVRIISVAVTGEVNRPGIYPLAATATPLSALYEAGGLTELANFRQVHIRRGVALLGTYDLYDYLLTGAASVEVSLQTGDVIFVPIAGPRVKITGAVRRPAIYEARPGESLRHLIEAAGGLAADAHVANATVSRILPLDDRVQPGIDRTVITVDLRAVMVDTTVQEAVFDGDSITIFRIGSRSRDNVTIQGSVWQPGSYQLVAGMTLWALIQASGGLKPETYSGRVQIRRIRPDSTFFMIPVALPLDGSEPPDNPTLRSLDNVTVFSRTDFRPVRTISVFGEVQDPGEFEFSDSMTLRDAVLEAGGVTDRAFLLYAEVSRMLKSPSESGDSLAEMYRVPLDSSYVFDPTAYIRRPTGPQRSDDFILEPSDHVFIRRQPGIEPPQNVVITGEVEFPGHYTLSSKAVRISEIIRQAGGLTRHAYANGIRFFRAQGGVGRISVDLRDVIENPEHRDNLFLSLGDSIHIPRYVPTVKVEGAVLSPTSVTYIPDRGTDYYVDAAGGYTRNADKGKTFVQQPNGLIQPKDNRPEAGAVVVVPAKDPSERGISIPLLLSGIAQALTALTTVIILLDRVFENQ
jgi:protein involved in polysaccharide export with SLBB domain